MRVCFNNQKTSFNAHRPLSSIEKLPPDKKSILKDFIRAETALPNSIGKKFNILYSYQHYADPEQITITITPINERKPSQLGRETIRTNQITVMKLKEILETITGQEIGQPAFQ